MIFNATTVDWIIVWISVGIMLASLSVTFILKALKMAKWQVRKLGHMVVNFVAAFIVYLYDNIFDLLVAILLAIGIAIFLSFIPKIRFLFRIYEECTRDGERTLELFINTILTGATIIGLFFILEENYLHIFTAAVLTVSIGDGMGEMIGRPYGKIKFKIFKERSLEGTFAVFVGTLIAIIVAYGYNSMLTVPGFWWKSIIVSIIGALAEVFNYRFIDNLTLPSSIALALFLLM